MQLPAGKLFCKHVETLRKRNGEGNAGPFCLWQPPHVCMCGSAKCSGVEPWLWGDDCYSTGVGFKNAFLMGMHFTGRSSVVCEANITAEGYRSSACVRCVFTRRRFISGNRLPSTGQRRNSTRSLRIILVSFYKRAE